MDEFKKQQLLIESKAHVKKVSNAIFKVKTSLENSISQLRKELIRSRGEERDIKEGILYFELEKQHMLGDQHGSPYFFRCDVLFDGEDNERTLYFGKFPFLPESIYSWTAPVSTIRFESPGRFSYSTPNEELREGRLIRKDQFMIVDTHIIFMSTETLNTPRQLVYQEYFSQQKKEFVLSEIVEQMEKAQDTIIRSHYHGSFLISGPAGSGKTTLALHKLAYLIQSPDTASLFQAKDVIVFVQDKLTKQYFSGLLPQLGIHKVSIVTFEEWAKKVLQLSEIGSIFQYGNTELEKDAYEHHKQKALLSLPFQKMEKNPFSLLRKIYKDYFTEKEMALFKEQEKNHCMDRFDLTILLKVALSQTGALHETVEKWVKLRNGKYVKKYIKKDIRYSAIIMDEAENYLAEQISVIKSCIDAKTQAMIYVGDLVQQTRLFTIRDWSEANETFATDRKIILQKVYRNTKQIVMYIKSLGYAIATPPQLRDGEEVEEYIIKDKQEEITRIASYRKLHPKEVVGILSKSNDYLKEFKEQFTQSKNVHILSINEAQGVEFDTVFLVGVSKEMFNNREDDEILVKERKKVNHDLLYVALTRAMNKLFISGTAYLSAVTSF